MKKFHFSIPEDSEFGFVIKINLLFSHIILTNGIQLIAVVFDHFAASIVSRMTLP